MQTSLASSRTSLRQLFNGAVPVVVLTLLWCLFFWRILFASPNDRVIFAEGDFTQHYYAFSAYQVERLQAGEFPLWNPYNHSGDPFAGNIQFVAFYPPRLIAAFLLGDDGWTIEDYQLEVAFHYWLASVLMYAFVYVLFQQPSIALFGSILYTYSGYLTGYPLLQVSILESVIWLPLIMLGVHLSVTRPKWQVWGCILGGVGICLSLLGGHPQTTMQISYLALAYLIVLSLTHQAKPTKIFLQMTLLLGTAIGLSAIQLLPALEFMRLSSRVANYGFTDKANGFVAGDFFHLFVPAAAGLWSPLYIGTSGILLAIGAMVGALRQFHTLRFFWIAVIAVGVFLSLGGNSIVYDVFYLIVPGYNIFRGQERIACIIVFALVILACDQLKGLLKQFASDQPDADRSFDYFVTGYLGLMVSVSALTIILSQFQSQTPASTAFANSLMLSAVNSVFFVGWVWYSYRHRLPQPQPTWIAVSVLIALLVVDTFTLGTRSSNYLPDILENRVALTSDLQPYQTRPQAITSRLDGAAGLQGYGVYFHIPDIYGTGPFTLATIDALRQIPVERFWEVLSVGYATTIDEPPAIPLELLAYGQNYTGEEYKLFKLLDPRPLAHLVYDYRSAENNAQFARQIMSDARVNLREMAVTLNPLPIELPVTRPDVSRIDAFKIISPEQIEMQLSTGAHALLTISVANYPGWQATLNGNPVEIVDTYAGLIGIPITTGENQTVTLKFVPQSVIVGAAITALTLVSVIIGGIIVAVYATRLKRP